MITLDLDWREVLWWMRGGMSGSHLCWGVYEDMVNRVWPQCSEQERRNIFLIMRRDLGTYWRPDGWNGHAKMEEKGEGEWRPDIFDLTAWMHFRKVLARFDPDSQYAITMKVKNSGFLKSALLITPAASIIKKPSLSHFRKEDKWESDTATITIRTYKWKDEYRINWSNRCAKDNITKVEKLEIPDTREM